MVRRTQVDTALTATDEVSPVFQKVDESAKRLNNRFKSSDKGSREVQSSFRNLASTAAILDGPLSAVAGRISAIGAAAGRMNPVLLGLAVTMAGLGVVFKKSIGEASQREQDLLQLEGQLKATGNAAGLTAQQLDELSLQFAQATLASRRGAREAIGSLMAFQNVSGETFKRALSLAQDYTAVFKGDLRSNIVKLGRALDNPREGLQGLSRQITAFGPAYRSMIADMFDGGQEMEAQAMIIQTLQEKIGGAGLAQAGGLSGAIDTLSENFGRFMEMLGKNTGALGFTTKLISKMAQVAENFTRVATSTEDASTDLLIQRLVQGSKTLNQQLEMAKKFYALGGKENKKYGDDLLRLVNARREHLDEIYLELKARSENEKAAKAESEQTKAKLAKEKETQQAVKELEQLTNRSKSAQEKYNETVRQLAGIYVSLKGTAKELSDEQFNQIFAGLSARDPQLKVNESDNKQKEAQRRSLESLKLSLMDQENASLESYRRREKQLAMFYNTGVIETQKEFFALSAKNHEKFLADEEKRTDKQQSAEQKMWNDGWEGKAQIASQTMDSVSGLLMSGGRKQFELGKKLGLASTVVSTSTGAAKALEAGPILGPILAAGVIAEGLLRYKTIKNTTFDGGGAINGGGGAIKGALPQNDLNSQYNSPQLRVPDKITQNPTAREVHFHLTSLDPSQAADVIYAHKDMITNMVASDYTERGETLGNTTG